MSLTQLVTLASLAVAIFAVSLQYLAHRQKRSRLSLLALWLHPEPFDSQSIEVGVSLDVTLSNRADLGVSVVRMWLRLHRARSVKPNWEARSMSASTKVCGGILELDLIDPKGHYLPLRDQPLRVPAHDAVRVRVRWGSYIGKPASSDYSYLAENRRRVLEEIMHDRFDFCARTADGQILRKNAKKVSHTIA